MSVCAIYNLESEERNYLYKKGKELKIIKKETEEQKEKGTDETILKEGIKDFEKKKKDFEVEIAFFLKKEIDLR